MRSIRLSLTIYFLLLVAAALGAVSVVVYHSAQTSLEDKQRATAQLLETRFHEDVASEKRNLDKALLEQAQAVAREVQFRTGREAQRYWALNSLGTLSLAPMPMSPLSASTWAAQYRWDSDFNRELMGRVYNNRITKIVLNPNDLPAPIEDGVTEYIQINSAWGAVYQSPSLQGRSFSFDPLVFKGQAVHFEHADAEVGNVRVRRALLLAPSARFVPFAPPPQRFGGRNWNRGERSEDRAGGAPTGGSSPGGSSPGGSPPAGPPRPAPDFWTRPALCIQFACDVTHLDATIEGLKVKLDEDLRNAEKENRTALTDLRNRLLLIDGLSFAFVVLGVFALVRLGLSPLSRVSDAVSQVTEKDFQLHLDGKKLPRELSPIVERLEQTLEQLKCAFDREKQATADISHELRTPLAALLTTIDVILRKPRSPDEYREALSDCRASAEQINHAVERLLALARLDAGVDRLHPQSIDAADVAKQCVAVVRPLAEAKGLHLALHAEDEAVVNTDPGKLREILNNLLHNAVQYNRPNGSIDVAVHRNNGHLLLEVRDTGVGIPPAARPHIFERFYRADPARQNDGLNAGLGLAIVKGYLELMGGTIDVDSVEGQGSTFCVSLPA